MIYLTDDEILNSKRVTVMDTANYLGVPVRNIQEGLQYDKLPFGIAYKKKEWVYTIFPERLVVYKHARDIINNNLSA